MARKAYRHRYRITYETRGRNDKGKMGRVVRRIDFLTNEPIRTDHQFQMAEILIAAKHEKGKPVIIVAMERLVTRGRAVPQKKGGTGEG